MGVKSNVVRRGEGSVVLEAARLDRLLEALRTLGYQVIGPRARDGAIVLDEVESIDDLPRGMVEDQSPGHYRLVAGARPAFFDHTVPAQGWKRFLRPADERLCRLRRTGDGFEVEDAGEPVPRYALLGVRACDLAAIAIQDRVLRGGAHVDTGYAARRDAAFVVAVDCARAAETCFCASMGTGPRVGAGHDLVLTELIDATGHRFVVEAGSERGAEVLAALDAPAAGAADLAAGQALGEATAASMLRTMRADVREVLAGALEHPRWEAVAARCLACGNCTMVCPTCFCSSIEDTTDLTGGHAERWRRWDSCFTSELSYVHGGSVRGSTASRYRQWLTHKLSTWHDQFDSSGCVGCGRCITWCPVGIDIVEEVDAIAGR